MTENDYLKALEKKRPVLTEEYKRKLAFKKSFRAAAALMRIQEMIRQLFTGLIMRKRIEPLPGLAGGAIVKLPEPGELLLDPRDAERIANDVRRTAKNTRIIKITCKPGETLDFKKYINQE